MKKPAYKWVALSVTTIGSLMVAIDSTIVILALPNMLQDLHSDLVRMTWVIMGYLILNTILQLTFGRMADMFGRVRMYNVGFIIFTLGSVLCGLALSDTFLIGSRLIQGVGGAMLSANAMAIITEVFPSNERGQAMGINAITWGAGSVLGPVLGGLILAVTSWRWIFLVNLPIGIVGTLAAYLLLHDIAPNPQGERFDLFGAALFCIGLVTLLLGLTSSVGAGLSPMVLGLLAVALVAFAAFVFWERHISYPMLDLNLFSSRRYAFSVVAATLQSLAVFAVNFLLIFYLQGVRGYTPLTAALLILPLPLVTSVVGPLGGRWADHDRFGGTVPATLGLIVQALALVVLAFLTPTTSYIVLAIAYGGGLAPRNRLGVASATLNTMRNVGMVCSFAVALAVAAASMPATLVNKVFLGTVGHLQPSISLAFTGAMNHAFIASALICLLAIFFSIVREGKRVPAATTAAMPPVTSGASFQPEDASAEVTEQRTGR